MGVLNTARSKRSNIEQWVDVDLVNKAFLKEYGGRLPNKGFVVPSLKASVELRAPGKGYDSTSVLLSHSQLPGGRGGDLRPAGSSELADADNVDPERDPSTALAILHSPTDSYIEPFEEPEVLPLLPYFEKTGTKVPDDVKVLSEQHDFYLMKYSLNTVPRGKERFTKVEFKVDYPNNVGFLTYSLTPDTELQNKFSASASIDMGVTASLGLKGYELGVGPVGGSFGGSVKVEAELIYKWEYRPVKATINATGALASYAQWIVEKPQEMFGSIRFASILRAPKESTELKIGVAGRYDVYRGIFRSPTVKVFQTQKPILVEHRK